LRKNLHPDPARRRGEKEALGRATTRQNEAGGGSDAGRCMAGGFRASYSAPQEDQEGIGP
jgi:hypothetical protein